MIIPASAFATALNAMRVYARKVSTAAESIASAGLEVKPAGPRPDGASGPSTASPAPAPNQSPDLAESMTTMLTAQRDFMAQQRVLEAAKMMLGEAVNLGVGDRRK